MSYPLFFADSIEGDENRLLVTFDQEEAHHLKVRRITPGERIRVSSQDALWEITVESLNSAELIGIDGQMIPAPELPQVTLFQGISKGERMDLVIRVACELGIPTLVPFTSERCIVRFESADKAASKQKRWDSISRSAAKQSGLSQPMLVDQPCSFKEAVAKASEYDMAIVAWEEAHDLSLHQVLAGADRKSKVALFIGPEGGLSASEVSQLEAIGAHVITLGETILRTETAGIVAAALVSYELGGLGNRQ